MPVFHHDLSELRSVAEVHVAYELRAMVSTRLLRLVSVDSVGTPGVWLDAAQVVGSSVLEAHLVHVRNLSEFLSGRAGGRRHLDSVVGEHYFDGVRVGSSPLSDDELSEIHSRVVHVSVRRREPISADSTWSAIVGPWAPRVVEQFRRFVDELGAVHPDRAAWFLPALEVAEVAVAAS